MHHLKITITFLLLLFFLSCKTIPKNQTIDVDLNAVLNTSIFFSNVYIGISPRMRTHERELGNAKLHIAHQIAMRSRCVVDIRAFYLDEGKDDFYLDDYGFDYNDTYIDEIIGHIEVIDSYNFQELVVVVGKDLRSPSVANMPISRTVEKQPIWVHDIKGTRKILGNEYLIGVGIADKHSKLYKGIYAADMGAALAIASEKETHINTYTLNAVNNKVEYTGSVTLTKINGVELEGFYIIDRWIEPNGSKYYSLGIARVQKTIQKDTE